MITFRPAVGLLAASILALTAACGSDDGGDAAMVRGNAETTDGTAAGQSAEPSASGQASDGDDADDSADGGATGSSGSGSGDSGGSGDTSGGSAGASGSGSAGSDGSGSSSGGGSAGQKAKISGDLPAGFPESQVYLVDGSIGYSSTEGSGVGQKWNVTMTSTLPSTEKVLAGAIDRLKQSGYSTSTSGETVPQNAAIMAKKGWIVRVQALPVIGSGAGIYYQVERAG